MAPYAWRLVSWLLISFVLISCSRQPSGGGEVTSKRITIKGSDTMVILGQRWAEHYMQKKSNTVSVQMTGGGSGTGIAALINGGTDICQSSRPMKEVEKKQLKARTGKEAKEIPVALDGIALYVHESNPMQHITLAQAKDIYTGKITNWKQLGGEDATLITYSRENNSGTYMYFKEHVLQNQDFAPGVQTLPGTAAIINAVSKDRRSMGYGGIAYGKGVKAIKVRKDEASPAVEPTLDKVVTGSYPLSRHLYFYTAGEPEGEIKAFIDWVLSDEGQKVCQEVGYYPLPKNRGGL